MDDVQGTPGEGFVAEQAQDVLRLIGGAPQQSSQPATSCPPLEDGASHSHAVRVPPFRVVIATDFVAHSFSAATVPPAVLLAFSQMFTAGDPVNLVFALDHEPLDEDAERARLLLGQLPTGRALAGVNLESFGEVTTQPTYIAVVPHGDPVDLVNDLSRALIAMHLLADTLKTPAHRAAALQHQHVLATRGDDHLGPLLDAYREVEFP